MESNWHKASTNKAARLLVQMQTTQITRKVKQDVQTTETAQLRRLPLKCAPILAKHPRNILVNSMTNFQEWKE